MFLTIKEDAPNLFFVVLMAIDRVEPLHMGEPVRKTASHNQSLICASEQAASRMHAGLDSWLVALIKLFHFALRIKRLCFQELKRGL
jgi:hypothetical protein